MKKLLIIIVLVFTIGGVWFMFNYNKDDSVYFAKSIPLSYKNEASYKGTIENISYPSKDFTSGKDIMKKAFVYLPYGYDKSKKYNIFYEVHGWTGYAGEIFEKSNVKNILDNMIENKDIDPLIFVSCTWDSENKPQDWGRSTEELEPFHLDFENYLMPYVESHYSTYAKSVFIDDLKNSRSHRAFGGFSLGGVTTWWMFKYDMNYIKYFLPMSGDAWYVMQFGGLYAPSRTVDEVSKIAKGKDYFIYAGLGTNDARYEQVDNQMSLMKKKREFKDKFVYYQIKGGYHDLNAVEVNIYNALPMFYK